ncbi:uncharacterized protein PRCAT00001335001 [Priceomyces carsonii]|uniref:uncharacterized protein n=1 Tax=Priceomyces carsonii TaxID=28549 RepID=UPI002EDA8DCE|nr:unnamed protein product [Priceomyces carsonii]
MGSLENEDRRNFTIASFQDQNSSNFFPKCDVNVKQGSFQAIDSKARAGILTNIAANSRSNLVLSERIGERLVPDLMGKDLAGKTLLWPGQLYKDSTMNDRKFAADLDGSMSSLRLSPPPQKSMQQPMIMHQRDAGARNSIWNDSNRNCELFSFEAANDSVSFSPFNEKELDTSFKVSLSMISGTLSHRISSLLRGQSRATSKENNTEKLYPIIEPDLQTALLVGVGKSESMRKEKAALRLPRIKSIEVDSTNFTTTIHPTCKKYDEHHCSSYCKRNSHGCMFVKEATNSLKINSTDLSKSWIELKVNLQSTFTELAIRIIKVDVNEFLLWKTNSACSKMEPKHYKRYAFGSLSKKISKDANRRLCNSH